MVNKNNDYWAYINILTALLYKSLDTREVDSFKLLLTCR